MMTGFPSIENAVESMKYGALNFYVKPIDLQELLKEIKLLADSRNNIVRRSIHSTIITQNRSMEKILEEVTKVASTNAPVLIIGESGTGKELVASSIHYQSRRARRPYIKVNCAAIPDNLLESEIFGHEKGAFTDAVKERTGKFELAHKGTIFFDEIGDMSLTTQPKILRVIEDGEVQRLGSSHFIHTDVRVISATNKDISQLIEEKGFRDDLYYRLSVVTISLPPLRERKDDLILLTDYFLDKFNQIYDKKVRFLSDEIKSLFLTHSWPGNIRELKNCIERAVIFSESDDTEFKKKLLPSQYREIKPEYYADNLDELYDTLTREKIIEALAKSNGVKHKAAELLNIHRKTLYNKMKKLGIE